MNIILSFEASNITTLLNVSTGFRMPTKFTYTAQSSKKFSTIHSATSALGFLGS